MELTVGRRVLSLGALFLAIAALPSVARASTQQCVGTVVRPAQLGTSTPSLCATPPWTCVQVPSCHWAGNLEVWAYFDRGDGSGTFEGRARILVFGKPGTLSPPAVYPMSCTAGEYVFQGQCSTYKS